MSQTLKIVLWQLFKASWNPMISSEEASTAKEHAMALILIQQKICFEIFGMHTPHTNGLQRILQFQQELLTTMSDYLLNNMHVLKVASSFLIIFSFR